MSKKVLIVEEEQLVAHLVETYVESSGCCKVIGAVDNGDEALEMVRKEKPDFILMDVRIEGKKDGIETAQDISKFYDVPIIYTSGNSDEKTIDRAKQTNMVAFLVKPLRREELISILCPKQTSI